MSSMPAHFLRASSLVAGALLATVEGATSCPMDCSSRGLFTSISWQIESDWRAPGICRAGAFPWQSGYCEVAHIRAEPYGVTGGSRFVVPPPHRPHQPRAARTDWSDTPMLRRATRQGPQRCARARASSIRTSADPFMIARRDVLGGVFATIYSGCCAAASVSESTGCVVAGEAADRLFASSPADALNPDYFNRLYMGSGNKLLDFALAQPCRGSLKRSMSCRVSCFTTTGTPPTRSRHPACAFRKPTERYCSEPGFGNKLCLARKNRRSP
jgi:hypothetical protein